MAIAKDASTPAFSTAVPGANFSAAQTGTSAPFTFTSTRFSPPAGSLVVVAAAVSYESASLGFTATGLSCADSSSSGYTAGVSEPTGTGSSTFSSVAVFYRYYAAAPGSITVSVTLAAAQESSLGYAIDLFPVVLTGCAASQAGAATAGSNTVSGNNQISVTPTATGSWIIVCDSAAVSSYTVVAGTANLTTPVYSDGELGSYVVGYRSATTAGTPVTVGWTNPSEFSDGVIAALEILPAAGVSVTDADAGAGTDAGGGLALAAADGTGTAADVGAVAAQASAADAAAGADGGELLLRQDPGLPVAAPSPAWLARWRRRPRQLPLPVPSAVADTDACAAADGGESAVNQAVFAGTAVQAVSPSYRAARRHGARPRVPAYVPPTAMTVTASIDTPVFGGGSVLQVYVLDGATQGGGAADAEAVANAAAAGILTPVSSGSFVGWACFNDTAGTVSANTAAAGNTLDANLPGTVSPVGCAGHVTGTVTAGTPLTYGLSSGTAGDAFALAAAEVPPLNPGTPVTLNPATPAGVTDATALTALTSPSFIPPPGTVLVAVYAASNGGAADHCTFAVADTLGLAWTTAAVQNSGGTFLAVVWTATVPTDAVADADAAGPALDFVSAAVGGGPSVPDAAAVADGGEALAAALADADAAAAADAVGGFALADADACAAPDGAETAGLAGLDACAALDGAETAGLAAADPAVGLDRESVTAGVPGAEAAAGTESDPSAAALAADEACAGTDAESLRAADFGALRRPEPSAFRARYRHQSRPALAPFSVLTASVTAAPDTGRGEDAEIDNPFPAAAPEACAGADAGETVTQADTDAGRATDVTFEFEFCTAADLERTAWPSGADACLAFDTDAGNVFPAADSDAGTGTDGGEAVQQNVPKSGSDAGQVDPASGEAATVAASVPSSDTGASADGGEFIPKDADAGQGADGGGVVSGLHADADFCLAFDVESRVLGPNNAVSDSDACAVDPATGETALPDVYAYQPPFRWTGGQFDVRRQPPG